MSDAWRRSSAASPTSNSLLPKWRSVQPNADYDHLTVVGHSMGGDITMYFAKQYPDRVRKVVTLDNLRVPFVTGAKFKILSLPFEGSAVQDRSRRDPELR